MHHGKQKGSCVQAEKSGRNSKGSMTFGSESTVSNLGSLEGNNHVGSRSEHGQVSSNSGGERHLEPIVRRGKGESSGKHLANRNVGGNIGKDGDNHDEPVDTWNGSHLIGATSHCHTEEGLRNTSIVERSNQKELSNEKHEKTVINFSESSLGLGDKFFIFGLDFVSVHVISLLGRKRVSFGIVLCVVRARIVVLTLVSSQDHEDGPSTDGHNTDVKTNGEADKEDCDNSNLNLGPHAPAGRFVHLLLLRSGLSGIVGMFLGKHLRCSVSKEHNPNVLSHSRGPREQFSSVIDEHHSGVDGGSSAPGKEHVHGKLQPGNVIISEGDNKDVLRVSSHGEGRSNVGGSGQGEEVRKGVGNLVANTQVNDDTREDEHDGIVHDSGRSNGGHGHDLSRSLPVDRVIKRLSKLVKESSTFHLLKVDRRQHEPKEQEERLHDDNALSIEEGTLVQLLEDESPDNHGKTSSESDTGSTDGEEPVGEHEENPESKVNQRDRNFSEKRELIRDIDVNVFAQISASATSVFLHTALFFGEVSTSKPSGG